MRSFDDRVARARRTNAERDAIDRAVGTATPAEAGHWESIATAASAVAAGLQTDDWDCVAEAFVLLEEILTTRPKGAA